MTLFYFLLHVLDLIGLSLIIILPIALHYAYMKHMKRKVEASVDKMILMPDREYKCNVRAAKKYLKSRGYAV